MEIYIATVFAKPGHEEAVTKFYQEQEAHLAGAAGFLSRQILRARPGTMAKAAMKVLTQEEIDRHAEPEGPEGTHFVIIESWDSIDERMTYSRSIDKGRVVELIPHLAPAHTHEYYDDVTP
jgi:quinol monooxygenase YgiN